MPAPTPPAPDPATITFDGLVYERGSLPDGWYPLEAVVVLKGLPADSEGIEIFSTATPGLTSWEALGMLTHAADRLRRVLLDDPDQDQ